MASEKRHDIDTEVDVPADVNNFLTRLKDALLEKDVDSLNRMYENELPQLTETYYSQQVIGHRGVRSVATRNWPQLKHVKKVLGHPQVETIYQLHQCRSQYTERAAVNAVARKASWDCFSVAFTELTADELPISLPNGWIWDIVDEFVYQLATHRIRRLRPDASLPPTVWNVTEAYQRLDQVVERSGIRRLLADVEAGRRAPADVTSESAHRVRIVLGYSALVACVKLRVLLGDYVGALETAEPLGVRSFGPTISQKIAPLHAALYYHVGFAYMMLRRYHDAVATLQHALVAKTLRKFVDAIISNCVALITISSILGDMPLHDYSAHLNDRLRGQDDDQALLLQGDPDRFKEVFLRACPKFITAADAASSQTETGQEAKDLQTRVFMRTVHQHADVLKLRGYLTSYSTLTNSKVGSLLSTGSPIPVEAQLVCMKQKCRQRVRCAGDKLSAGDWKRTSIVDFTANDANISVQIHQEQPTIAASFYDRLHNLMVRGAK